MSGKEHVSAAATHLTDSEGRLPLWLKLVYSVPRFSFRAAYVMQGTYVNLFYLSVGANISYMAFFIALARSLDVVTDPAMAWWTDNGCRTRFGRRKPFLVCGMFLYNISWYLFLTPPASLEHPGISIWFGLLFTCFYLCDTLTQIPYLAFGTEFTNSYTERNSLWFFSNGAGNVGTLLGMALPAALASYFTQRALISTSGLVFAVISFCGLAAIAKTIKEVPPYEGKEQKEHAIPFVVAFLRTARNRAFFVLIKSYVLDYFSAGMLGAMMPFYTQYVLLEIRGGHVADNDRGFQVLGYMAVAFFCSVVFGMPFWLWLGKKLDKRTAWLAYSAVNAVTNFWFYFVGHSVVWATIVAAINGVAFGGQFYMESVVADVVEYDNFLHGDKIEGMFQAIGSFVPKAALVFSASLPLSLIAASGFLENECPYRLVDGARSFVNETCLLACPSPTPEALQTCITAVCASASGALGVCDTKAVEPQPQNVQDLIMWLFCLVPAILSCLSFGWKWLYPIKDAAMMTAIQQGREAQDRGESAVDPLTGHTISPLCISTVEDNANRQQLTVLSHFSHSTVRTYLHPTTGKGAGGLIALLCAQLVVAVVVFVGAVSAAAYTIGMLNDMEKAWMPTIACIIAGADITVLFICVTRFHLIFKLRRGLDEESILRYLSKDELVPISGPVIEPGTTGTATFLTSTNHRDVQASPVEGIELQHTG